MKVEVLVSPVCGESLRFARRIREICAERGLEFREISAWSEEGEALILRKGIRFLPALLVDGRVVGQGSTDPSVLGFWEGRGEG